MSETGALSPLHILDQIEQFGRSSFSYVQHAAAWLFAMAAKSTTSLDELESASPEIQVAIGAGIAAAKAHNVDVTRYENDAAEVLRIAHELASGLTSTVAPAGGVKG